MSAASPLVEAPGAGADETRADAPRTAESEPGAEALHRGVAYMLALTAAQRLIGFARGVLFCRWLPEDELGQWSLAFGFLVLAAPLAVLGVPGSFGRYVAWYQARGQLRGFLRQTAAGTFALAAVFLLGALLARRELAWLLFQDASNTALVVWTCLALAAVIAFNFFTELLTALRRARLASLMQFVSGVTFAGVGLALVGALSLGAAGVVVAYGAGCLAALVLAAPALRRCWRELPGQSVSLPPATLWSKLLPFAGWMWAMNLLSNLFEVADQYMIVHCAGLSPAAAHGLVGQYHSSRVVPVLMVSVAAMLGGVLLPHLSHAWEAGRRDEVGQRLAAWVKCLSLAFTAAGGALLALAPVLFGWVLRGKYAAGLDVLPLTLVCCVWYSSAIVTQNYLWCAEQARHGAAAFLVGLAVNVGLNFLLLPTMGLPGAVLATAVGNGCALVLVSVFARRLGWRCQGAIWLFHLLPATLALGAPAALAASAALALIGWRRGWLLNAAEQEWAARTLQAAWARISRRGRRGACVPI